MTIVASYGDIRRCCICSDLGRFVSKSMAVYMERFKLDGGRIMGHSFAYDARIASVGAGGRIGSITCPLDGRRTPWPKRIKDSGVNEVKVGSRTERTQRRRGDRNVICASLGGRATRCITVAIGRRARIFLYYGIGLRRGRLERLKCCGPFMRISCLQTLMRGLIMLESDFLRLWLFSLLVRACWSSFGSLFSLRARFPRFPNSISQAMHIV